MLFFLTLFVTHLCNPYRFFRRYYAELLDLFQCDPVLLQVFMILCPIDELPLLITTLSPYYSLSWLAYMASEIEKMSLKDVSNIYYEFAFAFFYMYISTS